MIKDELVKVLRTDIELLIKTSKHCLDISVALMRQHASQYVRRAEAGSLAPVFRQLH